MANAAKSPVLNFSDPRAATSSGVSRARAVKSVRPAGSQAGKLYRFSADVSTGMTASSASE
ncbi:MAG: hypothetical protein ACI4RA_11775 [Kiritimatiellia bacterium]